MPDDQAPGGPDSIRVVEAIRRVVTDFDGVGKNQRNKEQGYNFRGIDDVLKILHPLLAKHGVVFVPDVLEREYEERVSAKGTVGHCCHLHVRYRIYGPGGDYVEGSAWGEGLDYGDKSTNKAMTAAFKYALFQVFAVSDPTDDGDRESPEGGATTARAPERTTVRRPPADLETGELKRASEKQVGAIKALGRDLDLAPEDLKVIIDSTVGRETAGWGDLTSREASKVIEALKASQSPAEGFGESEEPF